MSYLWLLVIAYEFISLFELTVYDLPTARLIFLKGVQLYVNACRSNAHIIKHSWHCLLAEQVYVLDMWSSIILIRRNMYE